MEVMKINVLQLNEYLKEKNIIIKDSRLSSHKIESKEDVFKQIDNIIYFQKSVGAYKENLLPRLRASIGKELKAIKLKYYLLIDL